MQEKSPPLRARMRSWILGSKRHRSCGRLARWDIPTHKPTQSKGCGLFPVVIPHVQCRSEGRNQVPLFRGTPVQAEPVADRPAPHRSSATRAASTGSVVFMPTTQPDGAELVV